MRVVLALGGGVIGDLAGFVAACYQRGVDFVQIADHAAGGRRFVGRRQDRGQSSRRQEHDRRVSSAARGDHRYRSAREPAAARAARRTRRGDQVRTDLRCGLLRLDRGATSTRCWRASRARWRYAIHRSCQIKAQIVGRDEREQGERALLNLGHTFGHAIEAATGYVEWLHGEAVALGMVLAADLSQRLGQLDQRASCGGCVALLRAPACRSPRRRSAPSAPSTTCASTRRSSPAACGWCCCAGIGSAVVTGDYPDAALQRHAGGAFRA